MSATRGARALEARELEIGGRRSISLGNDRFRAVVETLGGMVPELSMLRDGRPFDVHWRSPFRGHGEEGYAEPRHGAFWKAKLLYNISGNFPCCPSFGPACTVDGAAIPPHGWTANEEWRLVGSGVDEARGAAFADFALDSPIPRMPLSWLRRDAVFAGQSALFSSLEIRNRGRDPISVNVAMHNVVGPPFLAPGCRISLAADRYMSAPAGSEFDDTGRLAIGSSFSSLREAPLRSGGTADIGLVPGMIGFTDFVTGAVPRSAGLGWSCVANPSLGLAYLCLFPGAALLPDGEIALPFNDLWMQYGGRRFTPWAETEGGEDRTFCLGTENSAGAYANGLEYSRSHPELLGNPTLVEVPAGGRRALRYATAIVEVDRSLAEGGVSKVEADGETLVLEGARGSVRAAIGADFAALRSLGLA
jgi:hypothetical protein